MPNFTATLRDRQSGSVVTRTVSADTQARAAFLIAKESDWAVVESIEPASPPPGAAPNHGPVRIDEHQVVAVHLTPKQLGRIVHHGVALGVFTSWLMLLGLVVVVWIGREVVYHASGAAAADSAARISAERDRTQQSIEEAEARVRAARERLGLPPDPSSPE